MRSICCIFARRARVRSNVDIEEDRLREAAPPEAPLLDPLPLPPEAPLPEALRYEPLPCELPLPDVPPEEALCLLPDPFGRDVELLEVELLPERPPELLCVQRWRLLELLLLEVLFPVVLPLGLLL